MTSSVLSLPPRMEVRYCWVNGGGGREGGMLCEVEYLLLLFLFHLLPRFIEMVLFLLFVGFFLFPVDAVETDIYAIKNSLSSSFPAERYFSYGLAQTMKAQVRSHSPPPPPSSSSSSSSSLLSLLLLLLFC